MKELCPICKNEIKVTDTKCSVCGFDALHKEFISKEDVENHIKTVVEPARKKWDEKSNGHQNDIRKSPNILKSSNALFKYITYSIILAFLIFCVTFGIFVQSKNNIITTEVPIEDIDIQIPVGGVVDLKNIISLEMKLETHYKLTPNDTSVVEVSDEMITDDLSSSVIYIKGINVGKTTIEIYIIQSNDKTHKTVYKGTMTVSVLISEQEKLELKKELDYLMSLLDDAKAYLEEVQSNTYADNSFFANEEMNLKNTITNFELMINDIVRISQVDEANEYYILYVKPNIDSLQIAFNRAIDIADKQSNNSNTPKTNTTGIKKSGNQSLEKNELDSNKVSGEIASQNSIDNTGKKEKHIQVSENVLSEKEQESPTIILPPNTGEKPSKPIEMQD